jgi:hypothetical protein
MNQGLESFKIELREFIISIFSLAQIDYFFTSVGLGKCQPRPSARRDLIDSYYTKIDFSNSDDINRFLKVIENILLYNACFFSEDQKQNLRQLCQKFNLEVDSNGHTVYLTRSHTDVKNIIFASNGFKPEIVFSDSLNNDIDFIKHEESCLKYDRPIHTHGLLWNELIDWWKKNSKNWQLVVCRSIRRTF